MDNVTFFINELDGTEHAIIDRGNEEYTSMPKTTYEATLASELSNPSTPQAGE